MPRIFAHHSKFLAAASRYPLLHRTMISSRKKSCSACVQGRRRCDLQFPQCGRCLTRRATCVYPWASVREEQEVVEATKPSHWVPQECQGDFSQQSRLSSAPRLSGDLLQLGGHQTDDDTIIDPARLSLCPALAPPTDEATSRERVTPSFAPDVQRESICKPHQNAGLSAPTSQPPHDVDLPLISLEEVSKRPISTGKIFQARAEYAASRLVRQVGTLAETGQTSFIHHSQTENSSVLRDAFATCTIAMARNSANDSLVLSEISRRAKTLIEATETAISLMPPSSQSILNLDLLPYIQAMLIYQCIRLFAAGDIVQQTQAELDAESLARWIDILQEQQQWSGDNFSCITQLGGSSWKDWIRAESIRRTMIFAELLDGTYSFLKSGWYQPSARLAQLSFTGEVALWEARSPADWHETRGQKPWNELALSTFLDDVKTAFPGDLDEMGIIILVSYDGIDMAREWVGNDGRQLDKWGLTGRSDSLSSCYGSITVTSEAA